MTRQNKLLLGGLISIALAALCAFLFSKLQPVEQTIHLGPSPEARADRFLAAQRFLEQRELDVSRGNDLRVLKGLPSEGQSLLLLGERAELTNSQVDRLLEWTARGGHLLFVAQALWDEDLGESGDLLLDRLGIQQHETSDEDEQNPDRSFINKATPDLARLFLPGEEAPAFAKFDTAYHLYDPEQQADLWANSSNATHLLQLSYGRGQVTVVTDSELWENRSIGEFDHAWLLWYLTRDTAVTLIGRSEHPSLLVLLGQNFPQALTALGLLLLAILWRATQRTGPLLPPAEHANRRLHDHVRSLAEFHLRHEGKSALLDQLQDEIRQRAQARHPGFAQADPEQQHLLLSRLSLLPIERIHQAMQPPAEGRLSSADFTGQVAQLQTLRNAL